MDNPKVSNKSQLFLSIIICTYNRQERLKKTLESLQKICLKKQCEIIVIDNNSTDCTKDTVQEINSKYNYTIIYQLETKSGLSYARNRGIEISRGDVIAFLDDDAIPAESWIDSIETGFKVSSDIMAVGGPIFPDFEIERPKWLSKKIESLYTILDLDAEQRYFGENERPMGANMAFRQEVFEKFSFPTDLGRKGNSLLSGEEDRIFQLIREDQKKRIYYLPEMRVTHFIPKERLNEKWILNRFYYDGLSKTLTLRNPLKKLSFLIQSITKILFLFLFKKIYTKKYELVLYECRKSKQLGIIDGLFKRFTIT